MKRGRATASWRRWAAVRRCSATSASGWGSDQKPFRPDELDAIAEIARELGRMVQSARLFETEQHLVSELRELDRYKGELIATISHELKTPLTTIIGHVELLEDERRRRHGRSRRSGATPTASTG